MNHKGWLRVLALIIPYVLIVGGFQVLAMVILGLDYANYDEHKSSIQEFIILVFNLLGTLLLLWNFMKYVDKEKFVDFGFHIKGRLKDFKIGIGIGVIAISAGYVLLVFFNQIYFDKICFNFYELIISFSFFIIVAIVEEVLFRGYILKNFMLSFNKYVALALSSLLFTLVHTANPNFDSFAFFDLFMAGILLGLSYIFTKNLWFPIALHFSWNFFQTHFGFNVSGQDFYSLIEFEIKEKNLLNGGEFGFEGSIFSIIFQIIAIFFIYNYFKKESKI